MSLQSLRRWIVRHPLAWVLGLGLAVGGAQLAATAHEVTHIARASVATASVRLDAQVDAGHDCPLCLLAAALGGAALAPAVAVLVAPQRAAVALSNVERAFTPRIALAYASRAPPASQAFLA